MCILKVENVSYRYKKNHPDILKSVTCSFDQGKVYAIVGKSGSGKTTLLSLLAGFDVPTGGRLYYEGNEINKETLEGYRKNCVSYVFQDYQLFPKLTVLENVIYPLEIKNDGCENIAKKAGEILAEMSIDNDLWDFYPSQISGGEQQRVAIARALALGGKIMLADEPTGNLDPENGRKTIELFKKLAIEKNVTVIIVTHDLSVPPLCDCVYQMKAGSLLIEE